MLTFRLADSMPKNELSLVLQFAKDAPGRARLEQLLDAGHGSCALRDPRVAGVVESTLRRFDGDRYLLIAWVIMPNHLHALIETAASHPLAAVVQSWKSYTSKAANRNLGRSGGFWQADYFDRAIRDERHLLSAIEYIHTNPVRAGLAARPEDWRFSSAAQAGPVPGAGGSPALPAGDPPHPRRANLNLRSWKGMMPVPDRAPKRAAR